MRYADKGTKIRAFAGGTSVRYAGTGARPEQNAYVEKGICIRCQELNSLVYEDT